MKYDLVKFHHWLLLSTFRNKWFEENIKLQIISLLSWFIYPDFRKSNSLFSVLRQNKFILGILLFFIFWTSGFFTFGKLITIPEKTYEYVFVKKVEEKIVKTNYNPSARLVIENLIIDNCQIEHTDGLRELPDDIFFLMLEEISKYNIPPQVFFKVVDHESGFKFIENTEGSGAMGYCQIMPSTYHIFKDKVGANKHNPHNNIRVGAFLLKERYNHHLKAGNNKKKSWYLSLCDYAGGKEQMAKEITHFIK